MIPEEFNVQQRQDELLITPGFAVGNYAWKDWHNRWLRSLHIHAETERIISLGLPKFCNLGEGNDRYNVSEQDILRHVGKGLLATLKIDGSLLVRYVQNNEVKFRTRGSFKVGMDNAWEIEHFCERYPSLKDPTIYTDDSLLFEWVSPENTIVIKYKEPALFLIGGIRYDKTKPWHEANPQLFQFNELKEISIKYGLPLVHAYPLNSESEITKLIEDLKTNIDIEGFVLRFNDEQELVKVKAQHYIILHALKSQLTTNKLIELWQSWNEPSYSEFGDNFQSTYDYECWLWAMPAISSMFDGVRKATAIIQHVRNFAEKNKSLDRKSFALESQARFNQLRLTLCFLFYDNKKVPDPLMQKLILQNCKQFEMNMFSEEN